MSLIGVYPNEGWMTRKQLLEYIIFLESQSIVKEMDLQDRVDYLERVLKKYSDRLKQYET